MQKDRVVRIGVVILTVVISLYLYSLSNSLPREVITTFVSQFGAWAIAVFIFLNVLTYIIAPLSNTPLLLAGFYIFGQQSVTYLVIAMVISTITNYWITKIWGKKLVRYLVGAGNMQKVERFADRYDSWKMLLGLRLLQGGMHKFVSFALGLTEMNFWTYLLISLVGLAPAMIMWYLLSSRVSSPLEFLLLTQVVGGIPPVVLVIVVFVKEKMNYG